MKALDKVLRGCAVLALVIGGVALWRTESRAASGSSRAPAAAVPPAGRGAAPRLVATTPAPALPLDQTVEPPRTGLARTPRTTPAPERGELRIARLLVARDVRDREPVDPSTSFELARGEKLYAFVDVRGATTERTLHVEFVPDEGAPIGLVALEVAPTGRFRTWAFTRGVRHSGHWSVVVRDEQGRALAQTDFDVAVTLE